MKRKNYYKIRYKIIIVLFIFFIIGFIINVFVKERNLSIFERAIKDSIYLVQNIITYPISYVKDKIKENKEKNNIYENYKQLVSRLDEASTLENKNKELTKQLNDMKGILELNNTLYDYSYINATVISRDINFWNNSIVIDKGKSSGISINLPVVVNKGLIGKVISTSEYTSTVRLLTANNSNDKISVKIESDEYMYGLLNGYDYNSNKYKIEGVSISDSIKLDSLVTTTGMGDLFPSGIVIGKVSGISTDSYDLANIIEVESLVDFDDINYVTVLKRSFD